MKNLARLFTFPILLATLTVGCSSTRHTDSTRESGFLSDYTRLESDGSGLGESWANTNFRLNQYQDLFVPAVQLWLSQDNENSLSTQNGARIASLFRDQSVRKLEKVGWNIVEEPTNGCAILRMALSELEGANRVGSVLTSLPYMTTSAIQLLAATTDVHVFVGRVSTELQIVDVTEGTILAESRDSRVGAHSMMNMGSTWADVEDAIEVWTDRIAQELSKEDPLR